MKCADLFTLGEDFPFASDFPLEEYPWEWLNRIGPFLEDLSASPFPPYPVEKIPPGCHLDGKVFLHPTVKLPPTAVLQGPLVVGPETEIRPNAYIRGQVIIGSRCVIGNACECKNALILDGAQVPHFNYVGDSILGQKAHLGAGVILSNLRLDQKTVSIRIGEKLWDTGRRKVGAFLGDHAEVGCSAVLQPGTILGRKSIVFPLVAFGGYLPDGHFARERGLPAVSKRLF